MKKHFLQNNNGLTLLEMVIAVSLFTTVMIVASTMFLRSMSGQSKAISSKTVQESLQYAMTYMSSVAMNAKQDPSSCSMACLDATAFFCLVDAGQTLIFKNVDNNCQKFELEDDGTYQRIKVTVKDEAQYLTPTSISIKDLTFNVGNTNDATYPIGKATLSVTAESTSRDNPENFKLQTSVAIWP